MTSAQHDDPDPPGQPEPAAPAQGTSGTGAAPGANSTTPPPAMPPPMPAQDSAGGPRAPRRHQALHGGSRALNASVGGSPSTANSPISSRDTSPARPQQRQQTVPGALPRSGLRSRKSSTDVSPTRGPSLASPAAATVPSAAAIQRALSSANVPQLPPAASAQEPSRVPRPVKSTSGSSSADTSPHWPVSPRLKSPPPSSDNRSRSRQSLTSLRIHPKKPESATPSIVVQSSSPAPASRIPVQDEDSSNDTEDQPMTMKVASRGASGIAPKLETVQEASLPTTPGYEGLSLDSAIYSAHRHKSSDEDRNDVTPTEDSSARAAMHTESGGQNHDSKGKIQELRSASSQRPNMLSPKASNSSLSTVKSRTEAPSRNMTVETETVPSIAQATIGNQERSTSGRTDASLRQKASNETIRPKKKEPKPKRKAASINAGTASSKADVFEQQVARAVDDASASDSDATFIYESNPHEHQPHRSRQGHSRTPSMTSVTSLADPRVAIRENHKNMGKKSSMKFANPYNNQIADTGAPDGADGTVRIGSGRVSGGSYHHHIGRHGHGHGRGALSHILMDSDSSLPQSSRAPRGTSPRFPSQPNSPRFQNFNMSNGINGNGKMHGEYSVYDMDTENAADDERTPLVAGRSPRVRTPRQRNSATLRNQGHRHRRSSSLCRRVAGCLVLSILVLVLIFSAVGLVFATTKPLGGVNVNAIRGVIASQEALMLDLVVEAINPNIIGVTVADMDMNIFAKSKHVGSDKWWREHGGQHRNEEGNGNEEDWQLISDSSILSPDGIDEGTDPIEDPEVGEPRTMLLGRVFHFDSPLTFDGSFFKRQAVQSSGEIRLSKPGNKTEAGGTERWEEVLQYPFDLIVKGVLKYQLPLSTQERSVAVSASYHYDPDTEKKKLRITDAPTTRALLPKSVSIASESLGRYARALGLPSNT